MKLLIRWAISAFSIYVADWLVSGIRVENDGWWLYAVMAVILGLVNAFIRPILKLLTCPLIILTLGLFTLVINGLSLWAAAGLANVFGVGFFVDGFWSAFFGALIISIVSVLLNTFVKDQDKEK
ncbi:MAG: phage holin family protein [Chloroflexi bacterium]|nr:phage holin family protein [Chloroflexota bacterium]HOC22032.1 phage holin family protein [Anaerolineae bacterium]HOS80068.1 phage holin family protein [Anaerolineae bacterium]HQE98322.1 phage holin family protein [Anaerolineae bacterium]HQJ11370.1 phage holin family protein [Anaerolineae bacterium]